MIKLYHDDCFNIFPQLEAKSIDLVLCDMPYGTTACKWDTVIDLERMWKELKRIVKDNTAIVLTAAQPFTSVLICSNLKIYKYQWVWDKVNRATGYGNAKRQPLRNHEDIVIFYEKQCVYNPEIGIGKPFKAVSGTKAGVYQNGGLNGGYKSENLGTRYPRTILSIKADNKKETGLHPTQKPVALMEYLIKTYSNEGDTVLDFCMGSGTTGVACKNLNRSFIGIEKEENYFNIAKERVNNE